MTPSSESTGMPAPAMEVCQRIFPAGEIANTAPLVPALIVPSVLMAGCDIPEPLLLYSHFLRNPSTLAEPAEPFLPQAEHTNAKQDTSTSVRRVQDCLKRFGE
jgi:hypothetical protein